MPPLPGTGEMLFIALMVGVVLLGERVNSIGDWLGKMRRGSGTKKD